MSDNNQGWVKHEIAEKIATITFYHPKSNSLPSNVLSKLAQTISDCGRRDDVNVILLKSEGTKAFCAGASFDELAAIENFEEGKRFFMGFANVINAIRKCPVFVLAQVQGKAVGGGVGIACAADYTFGTSVSDVKLSELAVGIGPFVVGPAVERKIGTSAAFALAIDASSWKSAKWAYHMGLYADLSETIEELEASTQALAKKLANSNPEAIKQIKTAFWRGTENWDELLESRAAESGKLVLSDFTKNAIQAFKAK